MAKKFIDPEKELSKSKKRLKAGGISGNFNEDEPVDFEVLAAPEKIEGISEEYFAKIFGGKRISRETRSQVVKVINDIIDSEDIPALAEAFKGNVINAVSDAFAKGNGKIAIHEFISAARYVTYIHAGFTKQAAYTRTFPDRVKAMQANRNSMNQLSSAVAAYERGRAVSLVQAECVVPTYLLYGHVFHMAVNTQVELMQDPSVSPKVRSDAANSLMTHLKPPEKTMAEIEIKSSDGGVIEQLRTALAGLNQMQQQALASGSTSLVQVGKMEILPKEEELVGESDDPE